MKKIFRSILILFLILLTACNEQIVHDLSEPDANRILTHLNSKNVVSEKVKQPDGKWAIAVDKEEAVTAIGILNEARLIKEGGTGGSDKSSVISSREDQKFKYERNLSREIESTVATVSGVLEARVHLNMPATDPLFGNPLPNSTGSASVLVVARPDFTMNEGSISSLVSGASGIERSRISVIINRQAPDVSASTGVANTSDLTKQAETRQKPQPLPVPQNEVLTSKPSGEVVGNITPLSSSFVNKNYYLIIGAVLLLLVGVGAFLYPARATSRRFDKLSKEFSEGNQSDITRTFQ